MQARFQAHPGEMGTIDTIVPIRYTPGSRCTLRYHVSTEQGQTNCFGKLLAQDGDQLAQTVADLYRISQQAPELPRIARPLAHWPELQMLVQAAVPGVELHAAAFDAEIELSTRVGWIGMAGEAIAALHAGAEIVGPQHTLAGDLAALEQYHPALQQLNPELAGHVAEAIGTLAEIGGEQRELAAVVSHGALRTDQFLLDGAQMVLIDLDSVCWSSPARDLGNFLAYLTWKTLRQPHFAECIQQAQQAFLAGYQRVRPLPDAHWLALYQAASLLKILGRRYTGLTQREWPLTPQLLEIASALVYV
jgi:hypothetical protein